MCSSPKPVLRPTPLLGTVPKEVPASTLMPWGRRGVPLGARAPTPAGRRLILPAARGQTGDGCRVDRLPRVEEDRRHKQHGHRRVTDRPVAEALEEVAGRTA